MSEEVSVSDTIVKKRTAMRTRSLAFCGLTIALMAVSAWISIPLGPVPFTLQTFVMVFALVALTPGQCLAAIGGYLVIGAIGVPVFSSMRGGIGVLLGPTGGFLWGYLIGAALALALLCVLGRYGGGRSGEKGRAAGGSAKRDRAGLAVSFAAALLFIVVMYVCGWAQYMAVSGVGPGVAFAVAVAPFIVVDLVKTVVGVLTARAVKQAIR